MYIDNNDNVNYKLLENFLNNPINFNDFSTDIINLSIYIVF